MIISCNDRKLFIKVNDETAIKEQFVFFEKLHFTKTYDIYGNITCQFKEKKEYKIFKKWYQECLDHRVFKKRFLNGEFDEVFKWQDRMRKESERRNSKTIP